MWLPFTRLTLFFNRLLREANQSQMETSSHVFSNKPVLKAAEIAKFMALLDRRGRI